ncbi:ribose transport system ATP-binding protein/D-xylose transport system ATP-binding protein/putative multiple sugar transport system ATP-binding protein [Kribbella sp. VKM Ac-2527]|uniref:Ribose transport system ATP-binding protein/D-xylose transport system ATP-binding protein/putative multiple sugar transport system ATP-binding protein n=1 Tax=Kribbella caucasensis TaxID=2512215 RepID=A0A4R6KJU4_9ACTN|nr:sugar ABC transporter ATP-binding protein [Kribbella sp. VKM Ac-2527]TDO51584.1 ribose transport system ATP-binding protein/D-xylose transport system ATP-binding protein/putative multiple sugar transport system ATP-binding protein [Kribbella sp. VKM Ac-2527]
MDNDQPVAGAVPSVDGRATALLVARSLTKVYGSTTVLNDVDLTLHEGQVLAVVGENGAGKSTLVKILSGVVPYGEYAGTVEVDGNPAQFSSPYASDTAGVVMVPQELHVVPHLTIAENMFAAHLPGRHGLYDERAAVREARKALETFGLEVDPRAPAAVLTPSERRLIVLAAALHRSARVLILDEPTAALTEAEAGVLLDRLRSFRKAGVGIIYITHRLDELKRVADDVMVLRNGRLVAGYDSVPRQAELVSAMLGETLRSIEAIAHVAPTKPASGDPALRVRNLSVFVNDKQQRPRVLDVSLDVYPGEIVGLYGLVGAGRTELGRALFGAWPGPVTGECHIGGTQGLPKNTNRALKRGLSLLVEDRKSQGVFHGQSVSSNMTVSMLDDLSRMRLLVDKPRERHRVDEFVQKLGVRPPRTRIAIDALSGGNQQKVLLGRCLIDDLKVLILDEPTLGVDVGARRDIYQLVRKIARELEVGVLLISSDVDEVLTEADRILVMYKCRIRGEFSRGASAHDLMSAATGASMP